MAKMVDCGQVNPAAGCGHVIRAETEEEVLQRAVEHAETEHGMEATPELMVKPLLSPLSYGAGRAFPGAAVAIVLVFGGSG